MPNIKQRTIIHFMGICGVGKSTLSSQLANTLLKQGLNVIGTIDYDPHTPDFERIEERAFNRLLDQKNNAANSQNPLVHQEILTHSLSLLKIWAESSADFILVDRWYESYDNLPHDMIVQIETAIQQSDFNLIHVVLVLTDSDDNTKEVIAQRMERTKNQRSSHWWSLVNNTLEQFIEEEYAYQQLYQNFAINSPFEHIIINTKDMDWSSYQQTILHHIKLI